MADRISQQHRETEDHDERAPDLAEAAGRPLERKDRDPHHQLNRPVGEPDETADSDPYGD